MENIRFEVATGKVLKLMKDENLIYLWDIMKRTALTSTETTEVLDSLIAKGLVSKVADYEYRLVTEKQVEIPTKLSIHSYMHCGMCLDELPENTSPREWSQLEVGFTSLGLQVWCKRHEVNVCHINFEGVQHPANMETK